MSIDDVMKSMSDVLKYSRCKHHPFYFSPCFHRRVIVIGSEGLFIYFRRSGNTALSHLFVPCSFLLLIMTLGCGWNSFDIVLHVMDVSTCVPVNL